MSQEKTFTENLAALTDHITTLRQADPTLVGKVVLEEGVKNVRIVITDGVDPTEKSVFCFVNKETGDILYPIGYKSPAKGARGNIVTRDFSYVTATGIKQLTRGRKPKTPYSMEDAVADQKSMSPADFRVKVLEVIAGGSLIARKLAQLACKPNFAVDVVFRVVTPSDFEPVVTAESEEEPLVEIVVASDSEDEPTAAEEPSEEAEVTEDDDMVLL